MPPTAISPAHYNLIVKRIRAGRCVPFLGAGVNVSGKDYSGKDYKGLPLANAVALRMVRALTNLEESELETLTRKADSDIRRRLAQISARLDERQMHNLTDEEINQHLEEAGPLSSLIRASLPDLARVALHVEVETDFENLMDLVHEVLSEKGIFPSPLLATLASLPFKVIVTTNYDHLLERAFDEKKASELAHKPPASSDNEDEKPYKLVVQPINGFSDQKQVEIRDKLSKVKKPIIYKIHGSFKDNGVATPETDRLILTEEDYIQFLSIVGQADLGMPELIKNRMVDGTILFLGYSLQDWDFRTIYKILIEPLPKNLQRKSFAIQKDPPDFWVRYWEKKNVTILNVDLYDFAGELQKYWEREPYNAEPSP